MKCPYCGEEMEDESKAVLTLWDDAFTDGLPIGETPVQIFKCRNCDDNNAPYCYAVMKDGSVYHLNDHDHGLTFEERLESPRSWDKLGGDKVGKMS